MLTSELAHKRVLENLMLARLMSLSNSSMRWKEARGRLSEPDLYTSLSQYDVLVGCPSYLSSKGRKKPAESSATSDSVEISAGQLDFEPGSKVCKDPRTSMLAWQDISGTPPLWDLGHNDWWMGLGPIWGKPGGRRGIAGKRPIRCMSLRMVDIAITP